MEKGRRDSAHAGPRHCWRISTLQSHPVYSHWLSHTYQSGDRVAIDGDEIGTVESVFPDGIHMVKLDNSERVVAVTASHLTRLEIAPKQHAPPPHRSRSLNKKDQAR
jgi:hypothetical protein